MTVFLNRFSVSHLRIRLTLSTQSDHRVAGGPRRGADGHQDVVQAPSNGHVQKHLKYIYRHQILFTHGRDGRAKPYAESDYRKQWKERHWWDDKGDKGGKRGGYSA